VEATPGKTLALTAVIAPNARAAAQYYPGDYWYSLVKMPPKSAFPMKIRKRRQHRRITGFTRKRATPAATSAPIKGTEVRVAGPMGLSLKRGCEVCHQMGNKATREIEPASAHSIRPPWPGSGG
jgi:hypothetical protein